MTRRMTFYDSDIAERILAEVARGRSLTEVCSDPGMPQRRTVRRWVDLNRDGFAARLGRAPRYRPVDPGGAARAAQVIAGLL